MLYACSRTLPYLGSKFFASQRRSQLWYGRRLLSTGQRLDHDPLRILYCGADHFSNYSLEALDRLRSQDETKIETIEVVCRPDKRTGRGLKTVQEGT